MDSKQTHHLCQDDDTKTEQNVCVETIKSLGDCIDNKSKLNSTATREGFLESIRRENLRMFVTET